MDTSNYFLVVLGDPDKPGKDRVESGLYHPAQTYSSYPKAGDIVLFYCTGSYAGYEQQIPGVGVVLGWEGNHEQLRYKYLPLKRPIPRIVINDQLEPDERQKFANLNIALHWLFEISAASAVRLLSQSKVLLVPDINPEATLHNEPLNFPVAHDFGPWPEDLSLSREDMY